MSSHGRLSLHSLLSAALIVLAGVVSCFFTPSLLAQQPTDGEKLFALKVKNVFAETCNACHGNDPKNIEGGFDMRSRDALMRGGDAFGEKVVVLGKGSKSLLYHVTTREVAGYEMPPKEAEKLTQEQTWWIRDWIDAGAPWPDNKRVEKIRAQYAEGEIVTTSGGLDDDWTNRRYKPEHLWAYRPLSVVEVPHSENPVDWFIDQKLDSNSIAPAEAATALELVRRVSFGLTGLPPTPTQIDQFQSDFKRDSEAAVLKFATQLMESPHYGEHFGRQWLDVARYADSAGFANDYARPNAWRYRDYVVRSFNEDKPYNEFVRQQIAGDEMDPTATDNLVATGFLRMGPWEHTGMSVFRVTRQQWLDDVTDSVGQTFLAHPLQCCKCHDHKFDPLPTRDYYSMMAVFSTTQFAERTAPFSRSESLANFDAADSWTKAKIAGYSQQKAELQQKLAVRKQEETGNAKVGDNGLDPGDEASMARINKNIARHTLELDKTRPLAFAVYTGKTFEVLRNTGRAKMRPNPWAGKKGKIEQDTILIGGDAFSRGSAVKPAPISAATNLGMMETSAFPTGEGKRRLALAEWIVDSQNPLTARVIVNRVWAWHFGRGIAGNPNNFGATGELPTHPELLDYLAHWFVKNDWSIKKLNAMIVSSKAYQRSTRHPKTTLLNEKDPTGDLYATFAPRRLTAEEFRDAMLVASGELNSQVGGIPCRPEINQEVAMQPRQIMGGTASVYEPDPKPYQRNRRSIYAEKTRGLRDPFLETFNQPGPDKSCELRETSTIAPQALTLLNAEAIQSRALAFAARLQRKCLTEPKIIQLAFKITLGRTPTPDETEACLDHWKAVAKDEKSKTYTAKNFQTKIKRTVMAEKTGEPYDFIEFMPAFENYVSDWQPSEVDADTRALAQICLVLFNSNEFAYVD
ncbi:MAG: PSD1 and planctomycete cytochrome C domain-containing protein [Mariniblastus sp.]